MSEINLIDIIFLFSLAFIISLGGVIHAHLDEKGVRGLLLFSLLSLFGTFYALYLTSHFSNGQLENIKETISSQLNAKEREIFNKRYLSHDRLKPLLGFKSCEADINANGCQNFIKHLVLKTKISFIEENQI